MDGMRETDAFSASPNINLIRSRQHHTNLMLTLLIPFKQTLSLASPSKFAMANDYHHWVFLQSHTQANSTTIAEPCQHITCIMFQLFAMPTTSFYGTPLKPLSCMRKEDVHKSNFVRNKCTTHTQSCPYNCHPIVPLRCLSLLSYYSPSSCSHSHYLSPTIIY